MKRYVVFLVVIGGVLGTSAFADGESSPQPAQAQVQAQAPLSTPVATNPPVATPPLMIDFGARRMMMQAEVQARQRTAALEQGVAQSLAQITKERAEQALALDTELKSVKADLVRQSTTASHFNNSANARLCRLEDQTRQIKTDLRESCYEMRLAWLLTSTGVLILGVLLMRQLFRSRPTHTTPPAPGSQHGTDGTERVSPDRTPVHRPILVPATQPSAGETQLQKHAADALPSGRKPQTPPGPFAVTPPDLLLKEILACPSSGIIPVQCSPAFHVGWATVKGNVAERNEDYIVSFGFEHSNIQIVVQGDGCGGSDNGMAASCLGVSAAARMLAATLGDPKNTISPAQAIRQAIVSARVTLCQTASLFHMEGLHTTILIVVATACPGGMLYYGYLGDGLGAVIHADKSVERFLIPHHKPNSPSNWLDAWLGPDAAFEPSVGSLPISSGDVILCGTDGIEAFKPPDFERLIAEAALLHRKDLQNFVESTLRYFADSKDGAGWIVHDNASFAILIPNIEEKTT